MDPIAWLGTQVGAASVGILLLVFGYGYIKLGLSGNTRKLFKMCGVILVGYAALSYLGIWAIGTEEAPPASTVGSFDVVGAESSTWLTVDNSAQTYTWAVTYNYTAEDFTNNVGVGVQTNTDYGEFTFTVDRGLGTVGLIQTYGDVLTVPSITNDTTGDSTPVLTKTNDQYNAIWTREDASVAYDMITLTIAETDDGVIAVLNMTLSATAIHSMDRYDSFNLSVYIGGETWTIQVLLATVY
jgi:hypothetical protein